MANIKNITLKRPLFCIILLALLLVESGFKRLMNEQEWFAWSNKCLAESFDAGADVKLKKYEISLTGDHFLRLRKTYLRNKQEYYSFNLHKFLELEYHAGTAATDTLQIRTQADDIIVQTYDDPKGNIDSMANTLNILVKKISPQRLDSLREAFTFLKAKGL